MNRTRLGPHGPVIFAATIALALAAGAAAQDGSLMAQALDESGERPPAEAGATRSASFSMFHVTPPEPTSFQKHDLIQIIVREASEARSKHELEGSKEFDINGQITAWPDIQLSDLLNWQMYAGRTTDLPRLDVSLGKDFQGDGEYKRKDELVTRITAEVIEVLPNGNLVLEARTSITNDEEKSVIKVTGICRADDVSPLNTVLSNQIHDLKVEKTNSGELKKANEKGLLAKFLDLFWAW